MAVEQITPEQQKKESDTLQDCKESLQQRTEQNVEDLQKKATQLYNETQQKLANTLEEGKQMFKDVVDSFSSAVTGYENPEDVDIDAILAPLKAAFEPIAQILSELHIQIPGLTQLTMVFSAAKDAEKKVKKAKNAVSKSKSELTGSDRSTSKGLQDAATTIMMSISMLFLNIIIGMIAKILELITTLLETVIDIDKLPYPLNLIPQALKALPKIIQLARNLPTHLGMICDAICMKFNNAIDDAKEAMDNGEMNMPEFHMPCPAKEASALADKVVDMAADQAKPFVPTNIV